MNRLGKHKRKQINKRIACKGNAPLSLIRGNCKNCTLDRETHCQGKVCLLGDYKSKTVKSRLGENIHITFDSYSIDRLTGKDKEILGFVDTTFKISIREASKTLKIKAIRYLSRKIRQTFQGILTAYLDRLADSASYEQYECTLMACHNWLNDRDSIADYNYIPVYRSGKLAQFTNPKLSLYATIE